jgi:hypothetical protein
MKDSFLMLYHAFWNILCMQQLSLEIQLKKVVSFEMSGLCITVQGVAN